MKIKNEYIFLFFSKFQKIYRNHKKKSRDVLKNKIEEKRRNQGELMIILYDYMIILQKFIGVK